MTERECSWCGESFESNNPRRQKCANCQTHKAYTKPVQKWKRRLTMTARPVNYRLSHDSRQ